MHFCQYKIHDAITNYKANELHRYVQKYKRDTHFVKVILPVFRKENKSCITRVKGEHGNVHLLSIKDD